MPSRISKSRGRGRAKSARPQASNTSQRTRPTRRNAIRSILKADSRRLGLADLPAELRNAIYECALRPANGSAIRLSGGRAVGGDLALGLLGSCKAVRKEALGILFGQVPFRFDMRRTTRDEGDAARWPEHISLTYNRSVNCVGDASPYLHPEVHRTLGIMGPKLVGRIRSVLFVYHNEAPQGSFDSYVSLAGMPEIGDLAWRLDLVRKAPFCRFAFDWRYGRQDLETLVQTKPGGFEIFTRYIVATIDHRRLQRLARKDILSFAESIRPYAESAVTKD